jgi:DNA polymerase
MYKTIKSLQEAIFNDKNNILPYADCMVPGEGPQNATLMFVGEAPGNEENYLGRPFVGRAGQLFNELLDKAGIVRNNCYITNVVKSRPSYEGKKNKAPSPTEINNHKKWLWKEMKLINPKVIVTLGRIASRLLLKDNLLTMRENVGQNLTVDYIDSIIIPCWHPSYLLQRAKPSEIDDEIRYFREAHALSQLN